MNALVLAGIRVELEEFVRFCAESRFIPAVQAAEELERLAGKLGDLAWAAHEADCEKRGVDPHDPQVPAPKTCPFDGCGRPVAPGQGICAHHIAVAAGVSDGSRHAR